MNLAQSAIALPAPIAHAVEVATSDACVAVLAPNINVCTWLRAPPRSVEIEETAPLDVFLRRTRSRSIPDALVAFVAPLPKTLGADVVDLARLYCALSDAAMIHVQLNVVSTDKCKRFHVDNLRLRMVSTYVGPGTEWMPEAHVNRYAVYDCDCAAHASNDALVNDERRIQRVPTGAVAILKGEAFPGNKGNGIIHRSPPIMADGKLRLVLTIDDLMAK